MMPVSQPHPKLDGSIASAKSDSNQDSVSVRKVVRELVTIALVSLAVFFAIHSSIENFRVSGPSMQPTLINGQHLIANKIIYSRFNLNALADESALFNFHPPAHGDVVIIAFQRDPDRDIVKRIIGLPGDIIEIRQGQIIRNSEPLDEPYLTHRDSRTFASLQVPPHSYYVLGDNRRASTDSRTWGFVPSDHIIGRAWLSYWPSDRLEFLHPLW